MSALDNFTISNPATSILPGDVVGASVDSNSPPSSCESALAQLFELSDCSGTNPARANLAAGAGPALLLPAPAAFFPDICELLSYANGGLFYPLSPRAGRDSLSSVESDPLVTLDSSRGESISSPPLFLSNPSFEFTQSVLERGGVA